MVFVVRTGAIYPFTTISQTLAVCEMRKIGATLAVLGPGKVTDRGRSFGLLTGPRIPVTRR
jgi:ABC-type antimicrobial peptide transport system ATPase subunit